jgi:hypothetical protein
MKWKYWMPASASSIDVSHNLLSPPNLDANLGSNFVLFSTESMKWPAMVWLDLSYNDLNGYISLFGPVHYNFDLSHNNLWGVAMGGDGLTAAHYGRQLFTADFSNQRASMAFVNPTGKTVEVYANIDDALESFMLMSEVDFLPRSDSFELVEWPKGSGQFPFACPLW